MHCDVLVIGAGPAGLSTATSAAKRGKEVLCIEKKTEIGNPVHCGEAVSDYILEYSPFRIPSSLLEWKIDGLSFRYDNLEVIRKGSKWGGYSIDRIKTEQWLAGKARDAGVNLLTSTEIIGISYGKEKGVEEVIVKHGTKKNRFKADYFVAADGYPSTFMEKMGVPDKTIGGYFDVYSWEMNGLVLNEPKLEQFYFGGYMPDSFGYVFPKNENSANVGVASLSPNVNVKNYFNKLIKSKWLKNQFRRTSKVVEKSKIAPFRDPTTNLCYKNVFVVGDAANQNVKPFVEGFVPAIACGSILGEIIGTDREEKYGEIVDKKIPLIKKSKILTEYVYEALKIKSRRKYLILLGLISDSFLIDDFWGVLNYKEEDLVKEILRSAKS